MDRRRRNGERGGRGKEKINKEKKIRRDRKGRKINGERERRNKEKGGDEQ
jgi:hypothetical protein